eukprot:4359135-Alexandrium_andersonii.AAC.1
MSASLVGSEMCIRDSPQRLRSSAPRPEEAAARPRCKRKLHGRTLSRQRSVTTTTTETPTRALRCALACRAGD